MKKKSAPLAFFTVLLCMSLLGCDSRAEGQKARESGYVLYPLVKVGDGISGIGSGISKVFTPGSWSEPSRPERFPESPTSEQATFLNEKTIKWDGVNDPASYGGGFGIGSGQFPGQISFFMKQTENMAGFQFDWFFNPMLPDGAMAFPGGVIVLNPNVIGRLDALSLQFLLLHEAGHHVLGHTRGFNGMDFSQPWLAGKKESDADVYAAQTLVRNGVPPQNVALAAMNTVGNGPGDATHPPGLVRVQIIRKSIGY